MPSPERGRGCRPRDVSEVAEREGEQRLVRDLPVERGALLVGVPRLLVLPCHLLRRAEAVERERERAGGPFAAGPRHELAVQRDGSGKVALGAGDHRERAERGMFEPLVARGPVGVRSLLEEEFRSVVVRAVHRVGRERVERRGRSPSIAELAKESERLAGQSLRDAVFALQ
jgi:hypothetical protein